VAEASTIDFELARFEHLVETQRGHIVRVSGTWTTPEGRDLPHPTLVAGEGESAVRVSPLPIPGQDPPHTDGAKRWLASYSIPKALFAGGEPPVCRLQPAPDVLVDLPALTLPDAGSVPYIAARPPALRAVPDAAAPPQPVAAAPAADQAPPASGKGVRELFVPAIRAHRRLIMAVVAVALVGSVIGLVLRSPTYEGTATILVTPLPRTDTTLEGLPELRAGSDPAQTVDTIATIVRSPEAASAAAQQIGRGWTQRTVLKKVSVVPESGSNVIKVQAKADDPVVAARLANAFAHLSLAERDKRLRTLAIAEIATTQAALAQLPDKAGDEAQALQVRQAALERVRDDGDPTLDLLQNAAVPKHPAGLPAWAVLILTGLAGLIIGIAAAALIELLGPGRLDSEEQLDAIYPLPVLTRLPLLPRRRRAPDAPPLREALRTLQVQLEMEPGSHRSLMLTSASAGDGKTNTAIGFALELAASGRQVILIDLDLRKPELARRLGVTPVQGIEDVAAGRGALADMLVDVPTGTPEGGLQLLAPARETDMATLEAVARELPGIVDGASALADYVVLDTPPVGEVSDALTFARAVDDVLIVCRLGATRRPSYEAMRDQLTLAGTEPAGLILIGGTGSAAPSYRYPVTTGDFSP
jgi:tyrosine-protein kinase